MVQTVQKPAEILQLPTVDKVVDMPFVVQRQVAMVLTEQQNPVETPQLQVLGKVVDMPVVTQ